jgi:hypothetical protein
MLLIIFFGLKLLVCFFLQQQETLLFQILRLLAIPGSCFHRVRKAGY